LIDRAAAALRDEPLYVDPGATAAFNAGDRSKIVDQLRQASTPVYVAALPAAAKDEVENGNADRVPEALYLATGRQAGTYGAIVGTHFTAGSSVIEGMEAARLAGQAVTDHRQDPTAAVLQFLDEVEKAAAGAPAPASGQSPGSGGGGSVPWLLLLLAGAGGVGLFAVSRRRRARRAVAETRELARVRETVDEDITAYGEELDRLDVDLGAVDEATREDYRRGLDAYDRAKRLIEAARRPADVQAVSEALAEGRYALACVRARLDGAPLPEQRPPCFFDPRHGPSVEDVDWAPPGGAPRRVPVCAADATRIRDGEEPDARTVPVGGVRKPYWEAGPAYGPWAAGWFGGAGAYLPALLVGTMLGSALHTPIFYGADPGAYGWSGGGDEGGGDGGGDFGGGGGDFGGGDFGGGGGDFGG
jgi:hypothetical protein